MSRSRGSAGVRRRRTSRRLRSSFLAAAIASVAALPMVGATNAAAAVPGGGGGGTPTVSEVAPNQGPPAGGNQVIVVGTNLTGATAVAFGSGSGTSVTVVSDTEIQVNAPAGTGSVDVTVTTPGGTSATGASDKYTYAASASPTFTSAGQPSITLSPSSGLSTSATTTAQLSGTGFNAADALYVTLECNDDPNQPTWAPFAAFGANSPVPVACNIGDQGNLAVQNMSGGSFTHAAPGYVIESGNVGAADSGTDSSGGSASTDAASYPCPPSQAQQQAGFVCAVVVAGIGTVKGSLGLVDLAAQPIIFTGQSSPSFVANPPAAAAGQTVTLSGSNWPVTPAGSAAFQGTVSVCSAPSTCVVAPGASGTVDSQGNLTGTFTVPSGLPSQCPQCFVLLSGSEQISEAGVSATVAGTDQTRFGVIPGSSNPNTPTVSVVSPSTGPAAGGTSVTITGTNFASPATVAFGGSAATSVSVVSSTTITCTSPPGSGTVDVTVTSGGSTSVIGAGDHFSYSGSSSPVLITSIAPQFGSSAGGTGVVITGTGFTGATAVTFGGRVSAGYTVTSDTQIIAIAPAQPAGTVAPVSVTSPKGTSPPGASSQFFYEDPPTVTAISPASGNATGGTSVTITGTNFNGALAVSFGGVNATSFTVVSNAQIVVKAPAGTAGSVSVTVTGPAGTSGVSAATTYTYNGIPNAPTVTGVTPNTGSQGGGTDVTITGTNFVPGVLVTFGSSLVQDAVVVSNNLIAAKSPVGSAGRADIVVKTSGGTSPITPEDEFFYSSPAGTGYWMVGADGGVFALGSASFCGSTGGIVLNEPIIGMAATPDGRGYWLVATDGGIFAFGDAHFYGSTGSKNLNQPVVGMATTPDGKGYWLVTGDGGIFAFGDATFLGSIGGVNPALPPGGSNVVDLSRPITGIAVTSDGTGYWLVDAAGDVFGFGSATYQGGRGGSTSSYPIIGLAPTSDNLGYWLAATNGTVYPYGDASAYGSVTVSLQASVESIIPSADGNGYWLFERNGAVLAFGDAPNYGDLASIPGFLLVRPIVGAAVLASVPSGTQCPR